LFVFSSSPLQTPSLKAGCSPRYKKPCPLVSTHLCSFPSFRKNSFVCSPPIRHLLNPTFYNNQAGAPSSLSLIFFLSKTGWIRFELSPAQSKDFSHPGFDCSDLSLPSFCVRAFSKFHTGFRSPLFHYVSCPNTFGQSGSRFPEYHDRVFLQPILPLVPPFCTVSLSLHACGYLCLPCFRYHSSNCNPYDFFFVSTLARLTIMVFACSSPSAN